MTSMKGLLYHLPLIGALLIASFIWAVDTGILQGLRNERTFAWFVVVWMPLGAILALVQLILWFVWVGRKISVKR